MKYYDKLIFELSKEGRKGYTLPENRLKNYSLTALPENLKRKEEAIATGCLICPTCTTYGEVSYSNICIGPYVFILQVSRRNYRCKISKISCILMRNF